MYLKVILHKYILFFHIQFSYCQNVERLSSGSIISTTKRKEF